MRAAVRDIQWRMGLDGALADAQVARKPVVLKPLGQGMGHDDDW